MRPGVEYQHQGQGSQPNDRDFDDYFHFYSSPWLGKNQNNDNNGADGEEPIQRGIIRLILAACLILM
jgi:hypothetical protein